MKSMLPPLPKLKAPKAAKRVTTGQRMMGGLASRIGEGYGKRPGGRVMRKILGGSTK